MYMSSKGNARDPRPPQMAGGRRWCSTQPGQTLSASAWWCLTVFLAALAIAPGVVHAQVASDDANKSNNPLNPAPSFNLQDFYTPRLYGSSAHTNDFLLRGTLPVAPGDIIGVPQLIRGTLPMSTRPDPNGGSYATGLGDANLFDIFLFRHGNLELGVGPQLTIPTATSKELGTGKWQAGLSGIVIDPSPQRLIGGLIQWQASFAGQENRPNLSTLTAQPFVVFNLPQGWYVRSTATWNFNLKNGDYFIPVGLGAGKVWKSGSTIFNLFAEPQWTVAHEGAGAPKFQLFMGLNMTFGK
jgi:hypothetical protein